MVGCSEDVAFELWGSLAGSAAPVVFLFAFDVCSARAGAVPSVGMDHDGLYSTLAVSSVATGDFCDPEDCGLGSHHGRVRWSARGLTAKPRGLWVVFAVLSDLKNSAST